MQEWEYRIMPLDGGLEELNQNMNTAGFQGWELVSVTALASSGAKTASIAIFKRPLNL